MSRRSVIQARLLAALHDAENALERASQECRRIITATPRLDEEAMQRILRAAAAQSAALSWRRQALRRLNEFMVEGPARTPSSRRKSRRPKEFAGAPG